jgi:hypothetical protein
MADMETPKKFTIVVRKKADEFKATCRQMPGLYTLGQDREDTLKRLKILIFKKLAGRGSGGSGSGTSAAGRPVPVKPAPTHHLQAAKHLPPSDTSDSSPKD